jgi:hypothetical protein
MEDKLSKSLGMVPYEPEREEPLSGDVLPDEGDEQADYRIARQNILDTLAIGGSALQDLMDVAKASEHPRAYEVMAGLIKTILDGNKDLIDLDMKKQERFKKKNETDKEQPVNNTFFIGSTSDLQKALKNSKDSDD